MERNEEGHGVHELVPDPPGKERVKAPEGTFAFQKNLPRLPVPDLDDTCRRYLEWVRPLLDDRAFAVTTEATEAFAGATGPGRELQRRLMERASRPDVPNWLEPFWEDMYLSFRDSLVIHSSVFYALEEREKEWSSRAASLVLGALAFWRKILEESFPPDMERGEPLCMAQFRRVFGTTRVPCASRDVLRFTADGNGKTAEHVVVLRRGRLFRVDLPDASSRSCCGSDELAATFRDIDERCRSTPAAFPVGVLTALPRERWAALRRRLAAIPGNEELLESVETALFAVCCDEAVPEDFSDLGAALLAGEAANRWYDKSVQFVVFPDGGAGIVMEHAGTDGSVMVRLAAHLATEAPRREGASGGIRPALRELRFAFDEDLLEEIHRAAHAVEEHARSVCVRAWSFDAFGKERIKRAGVSSDAFVQLALQLAQRRLFGVCRTTYQAVMTRRFLHGRTEAMRPVTSASVAFVDAVAMRNARTDAKNRAGTFALLLRKAAACHVERVRLCKAGLGVDRHLWGLLQLAAAESLERPALYDDLGWRTLSRNTFSTSTTAADGLRLAGFGPVVEDGYGFRYLSYADRFHLFLSGWRHAPTALPSLQEALHEALEDLLGFLEAESRPDA